MGAVKYRQNKKNTFIIINNFKLTNTVSGQLSLAVKQHAMC